MRQLNAPELLNTYIEKNRLQSYFSLNLQEAATLVRYEEGELLAQMGELFNSFLILVEGECLAYSTTGTERIHCELHFQGVNIMGLVSVLWDKPIINTIRTITPCIFLSIPADRYRGELQNDAKFLRYTAEYLAAHIRKNAVHFEAQEIRLANFILNMEKGGIFSYNLTLGAELLGSSYRHLLRTLHLFCDRGLLRKEKKGVYRIVDREGLQALQNKGPTNQ